MTTSKLTTVEIEERDFSGGIDFEDVTFTVESYSKAAIGGCERATIAAKGGAESLQQLLSSLRRGTRLVHPYFRHVWWGYIAGIELMTPTDSLSLSIDPVVNRVAVAFLKEGRRYTTSWAEDLASVDTYGIKEVIQSLSVARMVSAERKRDRALAAYSDPLRNPRIKLLLSNADEWQAKLLCRGWWDTGNWQRYTQTIGSEKFLGRADGYRIRSFGYLADVNNYVTKVAQRWQLADAMGWDGIDTVAIEIAKIGSPEDLIIRIYQDVGNLPTTLLGSVTVDAADISTSYGYIEVDLPTAIPIGIGGTYWIVLEKDGPNSNTNYYSIRGTKPGTKNYARGWSLMWLKTTVLSAGWRYNTLNTPAAPDTDVQTNPANASYVGGDSGNNYDMHFKLLGQWSGERQMQEMAEELQFITGVEVTGTAEGSSPTRNGDRTIQQELLQLMEAGTDDNRRFLAQVTSDRRLLIYPEPERPDPDDPDGTGIAYYRDGDTLLDGNSQVGEADLWALCPAGVWVRSKNLPAPGQPIPGFDGLMFLERVEYNAKDGKPSAIETREQPSPWSLGRLR